MLSHFSSATLAAPPRLPPLTISTAPLVARLPLGAASALAVDCTHYSV